MFVIFCQVDKLITVCVFELWIMLVVIFCMYVSMFFARFESSILMIVMTNVNSLCILMEITFFLFNFTREANQKSGNNLARNSQQHFLLSSPGPTKIYQIHTDIQKSKYTDRYTYYCIHSNMNKCISISWTAYHLLIGLG